MLSDKDKKKLDALLVSARSASLGSASLSTALKKKILLSMAASLKEKAAFIIRENKKDMADGENKRLSTAMLDRLKLDEKRIKSMADSVKNIALMQDPVGEVIDSWTRPNGIRISRVRVPIGVIAIIYEARPNVTSDCVALCLKSSNMVILRGGSDAFNSNKAIVKVLKAAAFKHTEKDVFFFVENTDRESVDYILQKGEGCIDLAIPRGGKGLIKKVMDVSRVPVIKHYEGVCHVYIDRSAPLKDAVSIAYNAKVQRPSVCNAMECLLVHKDIAEKFLPVISTEYASAGVEIFGCRRTRAILPHVSAAKADDFGREFLELKLAVKIVDDTDEAVAHINRYGSGHTDSIVSKSKKDIQKFVDNVQSACVFSNISTRFSDGGEFGLGAEMGISTDKLHARGPMGLKELTTYKYVVMGDGQIRG